MIIVVNINVLISSNYTRIYMELLRLISRQSPKYHMLKSWLPSNGFQGNDQVMRTLAATVDQHIDNFNNLIRCDRNFRDGTEVKGVSLWGVCTWETIVCPWLLFIPLISCPSGGKLFCSHTWFFLCHTALSQACRNGSIQHE